MLFADFPNSKFWFPEFVSSLLGYNWVYNILYGLIKAWAFQIHFFNAAVPFKCM